MKRLATITLAITAIIATAGVGYASILGSEIDQRIPVENLQPAERLNLQPDIGIHYGQPVPNMVPPQQLHIIFTEDAWGDGWGGDASMIWAFNECEDMGGVMEVTGTSEWTCWDVDW